MSAAVVWVALRCSAFVHAWNGVDGKREAVNLFAEIGSDATG
jgi:hypothetical protein